MSNLVFLRSLNFIRKQVINLSLLIFLVGIFVACAKVVPPGGGEIDRDPPKLQKVLPDSELTDFNYKEIVFTFDEYFILKNPNTNIYFSPLIDGDIEHKIKRKNLIIKIPSTLKENQTYNLVLNNTVADYNEGNLLPLLKYSFSTGPVFDSLGLQSRVVDAFKLSGVGNVQVYLIPYPADSALLKKQFAHFATSVEGGGFEFGNLSAGKYLLFALEEKSVSHVISSVENRIGFHNEPIIVEKHQINDSTFSLITKLETPIFLFQEKDTVMKIIKSSRVRKGLHEIVFNNEPNNVEINLLNKSDKDSVIIVSSKNKDSVNVWFLNQDLEMASLEIIVNEKILDTVSVSLRQLGRGSQQDSVLWPKLSLHSMIESSKIRKEENLKLWFSNPASEIISDSVLLIHNEDTIAHKIFINDSIPNIIEIEFEKQEGLDYEIIFKRSAIIDCFKLPIDSSGLKFSVLSEEYFGGIKLILDEAELPECFIFELMNSSGELSKKYIYNSSQSEFLWNELLPGDYVLRLIIDDNCNGQWDTGNFELRKQPERVIKSEFKISVKSNWVNESIWSIEF